MFEPIAIIGRGCVLPGALTPQDLWDLLVSGRNVISDSPYISENIGYQKHSAKITTNRGAYVTGFDDVFNANEFNMAQYDIAQLDPVFKWLLYSANEALNEAKQNNDLLPRTGFIAGNLSYPTRSLNQYAEAVWANQHETDSFGKHIAGNNEALSTPINRFMSGAPAHIVSSVLNLGGVSFCLDAACSSSLYAIKLACDQLQDKKTDLMLAGAVNHADDYFLHVGFSSLHALSPSGRSRPFHQDADGLLPAEGAAVLVLKRLSDANKDNDKILGVIRGIGLSNDGHSNGFLAPSSEGQIRAMHAAYEQSGLTPSDISLVECHATGTIVGDTTEITSMKEIFSGNTNVAIGSLKSNMGHLITTSGVASIMKIIGAMQQRTLPATINCENPTNALNNSPFRLIHENEPWASDKPLRAAINNFGFGGNNAHLILEQPGISATLIPQSSAEYESVAIVALSTSVNDGDLYKNVFQGAYTKIGESNGRTNDVSMNIESLNIPPADLRKALAQQTLLLSTSFNAVQQVKHLSKKMEKIGVYIGMQCDAEINRYNLRWKLPGLIANYCSENNIDIEDIQISKIQDSIINELDAAGVIGSMPNIVANQLNMQFNCSGASFTVSSEELSGITALQLACRSLQHRELDAALVGAVDLSCESVHTTAAKKLLPDHFHEPCDAAVVLVLKRLSDAKRDHDRIFAIVEDGISENKLSAHNLKIDINDKTLTSRFGHSHCASGLLHVALGAISCASCRIPPKNIGDNSIPWLPSLQKQYASIEVKSFTGQRSTVNLSIEKTDLNFTVDGETSPRLYQYAANNRETLLRYIKDNCSPNGEGEVKLVVIATGEKQLRYRLNQAQTILSNHLEISSSESMAHEIYFREKPIDGELAFVFTAAAAAYHGMGRELLVKLPSLSNNMLKRCPHTTESVKWIYEPKKNEEPLLFDQLRAASFLSQIHNELSQTVLGIKPDAVMGLSTGETNSLFAMGVWQDIDDMFSDIEATSVYSHSLGGNFDAAAKAWNLEPGEKVNWRNWYLRSSPEEIQRAVKKETRVHTTIIQSPNGCVIGGDASACQRVINTMGASKAFSLHHNMIVHCPELQESSDAWQFIHRRITHNVERVRFYTNATNSYYHPDIDSACKMILTQAINPINFPQTIENAWRDGVRVFIEHGPNNSQSTAIKEILRDKEHIALSLDRPGTSDVNHIFHVCAQLLVAGIKVDYQKLEALLLSSDTPQNTESNVTHRLQMPAHPPQVKVPNLINKATVGIETMEPAPFLFPVSESKKVLKSELRSGFNKSSASRLENHSNYTALTLSDTNAGHIPGEHYAQVLSVANQHQYFIQTQTRLHKQFLHLFSASGSGPLNLDKNTTLTRNKIPATNINEIDDFNRVDLDRQSTQPISKINYFPLPPIPNKPRGQSFNRRQLESLASESIVDVFGPEFKRQTQYAVQVRLPMPPLLLTDRVTGLVGEANSMTTGTIWSETDVKDDAWYMHAGRMLAGITIESGQADLLLASWLGADNINRGERYYRLLGGELTFHRNGLPVAKDVLRFEITIDENFQFGDIRMFSFHYDCWIEDRLFLSLREGKAGFFTRAELDNSKGILWKAEDDTPKRDARLDTPPLICTKRGFNSAAVTAFAEGNAYECFGEGFEIAATHQRTPNIPCGRMQLIQEISRFDPKGGPWGRGYMSAITTLSDDEWFYKSHFLNDPCMPGTLMIDAALQAMAFYIAALGFTLDKDGWIFEPIPNESLAFSCRGQVVPGTRIITYELHVEEIICEPFPTIYAALLCYADDLKVFHYRRYGLRLVPDWPLSSRQYLLTDEKEYFLDKNFTVRGDKDALLSAAWGKPSGSLGPLFTRFDQGKPCTRLPGPPYLFLTKIKSVDCEPTEIRIGTKIVTEFVLDSNAWFYNQYSNQSMPFCVLLEAVLQPGGWLCAYMGFPLHSEKILYLRNLEGSHAIQYCDINAKQHKSLTTHVTFTHYFQAGNFTHLSFHIKSFADDKLAIELDTSYGFFDTEALAEQIGLPVTDDQRKWVSEKSDLYIDLQNPPLTFKNRLLRLPQDKLLMLDAITGYWPDAGEVSLGRIRGGQKIDNKRWYFKAHFYQDPVQPGSLGIEALLQLLQCYMLLNNLQKNITNPRFEPVALNQAFSWKYRGQITPDNKEITSELEIIKVDVQDNKVLVLANGSLWVDGIRIYEVKKIGMRIV